MLMQLKSNIKVPQLKQSFDTRPQDSRIAQYLRKEQWTINCMQVKYQDFPKPKHTWQIGQVGNCNLANTGSAFFLLEERKQAAAEHWRIL